MELVNTWGLCDPILEVIEERTDTADLRHLRDPQPYWFSYHVIYQCISVQDDYLILTDGFNNYRAEPDDYTPLKSALFKWGDVVYIRKKLDRPRRVIDIGFHWQNKVIVYRVESSDALGIAYWFDHQLISAKEIDID